MNKTAPAHISLFISMAIYAAGFTIIKEVTPQHLGPMGFVALRLLGATPVLWLAGLFLREKAERADIPKFALLSLCGVTINQTLFVRGMSLTSPINGAIIMITSPLLVLVLGSIILKERITLLRFAGIAVGLAGAVLLILTGTLANAREDSPLGDLFIFINALSWGTFLVLVKPMMKKYSTVMILKWVFLFGMIIIVPLGIPDLQKADWKTFSESTLPDGSFFGTVWFNIAFVVFGVTLIAYQLNTYALKALSPSVVSAYIYLQPVMAAGIALYFGKDSLTWEKVLSAALIFTGVMMASKAKNVMKNDAAEKP
ncbi:MAG TPA: DMT family transporter [Bacteroidia bacterium]|nr:DMT family transporter [Bacteroidia bacterium]